MQKILVVEDDLDIQELLKNFLQEAGYSIVLANDGVEALSIFSDVQFDLILLDIMLPKIDGFAVCELIRKQSQVPIGGCRQCAGSQFIKRYAGRRFSYFDICNPTCCCVGFHCIFLLCNQTRSAYQQCIKKNVGT